MASYMPQKADISAAVRERPANQVRQLFVKTGLNSRADGSAYYESEQLKVLCTVYGPRATNKPEYTERAELRCDVKLASFAGDTRKTPGQSDEERAWAAALEATLGAVVLLEKYPKSVIDVFVLIVERDGSVLAASINAGSLALANAGIEMRDLVSAVSVGSGVDGLVVDCSEADEKQLSGGLTIASLASTNAIVQIHSQGGSLAAGGSQGLPLMISLALDANAQLRELCATALKTPS